MTLTGLLIFATVYAVAVATPGPGIAALVARTLGRGTTGAVPFILGFVVGDLAWFIAAAAGLAVIAKAYAPLFVMIKYAGCLYLAYIAFTLWRAEPAVPGEAEIGTRENAASVFAGSLLLTLGNPKVMVFFLSIMPLVVSPADISLLVGIELALTIAIVISTILFGYMLLADRARRLFRSRRAISIIQKGNAAVLAGAAAAIASR